MWLIWMLHIFCEHTLECKEFCEFKLFGNDFGNVETTMLRQTSLRRCWRSSPSSSSSFSASSPPALPSKGSRGGSRAVRRLLGVTSSVPFRSSSSSSPLVLHPRRNFVRTAVPAARAAPIYRVQGKAPTRQRKEDEGSAASSPGPWPSVTGSAAPAEATWRVSQGSALRSVVRLEVAASEPDYSLPWQKGDPFYSSGSACIIESPPGA